MKSFNHYVYTYRCKSGVNSTHVVGYSDVPLDPPVPYYRVNHYFRTRGERSDYLYALNCLGCPCVADVGFFKLLSFGDLD